MSSSSAASSSSTAKPAPLGSKFLQSMAAPCSSAKDDAQYYSRMRPPTPSSQQQRPAAGLVSANYRCPSGNTRLRWNDASSNTANYTYLHNLAKAVNATPMRAPSPVRKAPGACGPRDHLTVGLIICDSPSNNNSRSGSVGSARGGGGGFSPVRRSAAASYTSIAARNHMYGSGAIIDASRASTPRARGKMMAGESAYHGSIESPRPTGLRQVRSSSVNSSRCGDSPYRGLGMLGPDPDEKKERQVPPPMVLKPHRRGVRYVPEPGSDSASNRRYSDDSPFRHSKRYVPPYTRDPTPTGVRTYGDGEMDRSRVPQVVNFVGAPYNQSKRDSIGSSIRCVSPHTPVRRAFNIISNQEC